MALPGFNYLECSVTPTFRSRNRFYLQLHLHCPKMNKKRCGKLKKSKISVHGTSNPAIARRLKLRSLNANLLFKDARAQKTSDVQIFVKL